MKCLTRLVAECPRFWGSGPSSFLESISLKCSLRSFFSLKIYLFWPGYVCLLVCMHTICSRCPWEPEEGGGFPVLGTDRSSSECTAIVLNHWPTLPVILFRKTTWATNLVTNWPPTWHSLVVIKRVAGFEFSQTSRIQSLSPPSVPAMAWQFSPLWLCFLICETKTITMVPSSLLCSGDKVNKLITNTNIICYITCVNILNI